MCKDMWIRPLKGLCGFGLISFADVLPDAVGISCCFPVNFTSLVICCQKKEKTFPRKHFNQNLIWLNNSDLQRLQQTKWIRLLHRCATAGSFGSLAGDQMTVCQRKKRSNAWLTKIDVLIWDSPTERVALNETRQGNTSSQTVIQNNRPASSGNAAFWLLNCLQTCVEQTGIWFDFSPGGLMRSMLGRNPRRVLPCGQRNSLSLHQKKEVLFCWTGSILVTNQSPLTVICIYMLPI